MNIVQRIDNKVSEADYRKIKDKLSYSALKTFADNRIKFFKEYILQEPQEDKSSESIILGSLVDCLLFTPEEFDNKFHIAVSEKPTGQMGELCDKMISLSKKYKGTEITFSTIFEEAVEFLKSQDKFKGKDQSKILDLYLSDQNAETYYLEHVDADGKIMITTSQVSYAQKLVDDALNCPFEAGDILRQGDSEYTEVHNQLAIYCDLGKTILGISEDEDAPEIPFKLMMDKVIINHITKTIYKYDLKTTWENEDFEYNFLKMKYYIQLGVYDLGFKQWIEDEMPHLSNYKVEPLAFIAIDSKGISTPIVYKTDDKWSKMAVEGFETKSGRQYKGVKQLVNEIRHHLSTGNWMISEDNYRNNGVTNLKKP